MSDLLASFGKPFAYQVAAFRLRLMQLAPTTGWDKEIWQAQHDRAFMVAGAMKADVLADLAAMVDKAIAQGGTLEEFRRDFRAMVENKGWQISPAGQGTKGGEAWRTKVIYKTNMATSYAAGRMAQLRAARFKFFVYRHGGSLDPRPQHLAWDGLVLPADHPFWITHAPPNGWGCSCRIQGADSPSDARRVGGKPDKELPPNWNTLDPKTGAPTGIDRGWNYAPGASVADTVSVMADKAVNWDYSLAVAFMRGVPEENRDLLGEAFRRSPVLADDLARWVNALSKETPPTKLAPMKTLGLVKSETLNEFSKVAKFDLSSDLYDFAIDQDAVRHVLKSHGDDLAEAKRGQRGISAQDFGSLAGMLDSPKTIEWGTHNGKRHLVLTWEMAGEKWTAVFDIRTGRRRINLVSMWIEVIAGASPPFTP